MRIFRILQRRFYRSCGMFLDLSCEIIDGLTHLERSPMRYLHSAHPKDVYNYKQYVYKEFMSHHIIQRASDLYELSGPIKEDNVEYKAKLNELDNLVLQIQLQADKKHCMKRSKFDWSDDINSL